MEKLNKLIFNGEEYIPKKVLLKWVREISDAVNSFSDKGDPIRAQGANKVIRLLLEKIEPPQEHWRPSEEQMEALKCAIADVAKFSKRGGRQVELENEPYYSALHSLYCNLEKLM